MLKIEYSYIFLIYYHSAQETMNRYYLSLGILLAFLLHSYFGGSVRSFTNMNTQQNALRELKSYIYLSIILSFE